MIKTIFRIYKQVADAQRKQKELDRLKAVPLNYGIIRELVNSAQHGVAIEVKLIDGSSFTIKQEVQALKMPQYGENF